MIPAQRKAAARNGSLDLRSSTTKQSPTAARTSSIIL
jgi:hypothetical protein